MKVHSVGSDDIFNFVPRSMLPVEVGGTGISYNPLTGKIMLLGTDTKFLN